MRDGLVLVVEGVCVLLLLGVAAAAGVQRHGDKEDSCLYSGISMDVSGLVQKLKLPSSKEVFVVESSKGVRIECRAKSPIRLSTKFEIEKQKFIPPDGRNQSQGVQKAEKVLWKENETNFWSSKTVNCSTGEGACSYQLNLANKPDNVTNCTVGNEVTCTIQNWYEEVQKDRSGGHCEKKNPARRKQKPIYEFSFYNHETKEWTVCNKTGVGKEKSFDNVSQIVCDAMGHSIKDSDSLIIRLSKSFTSTSFFDHGTVNCQESTYLSVSGDFFVMKMGEGDAISEDNIIIIAVLAAVAVLALLFITVGFVRKQRRGGNGPSIVYNSKSTTYHRTNPDGAVLSEGEEDDEEGDTGEGPRVSITINSSSDKEAIAQEEDNRNMLNKILGGSHSVLNPGILINKQTNALQYDKSLEVHRDSFSLDFIIGEGQYGTVYRATARGIKGLNPVCKVAVKQVKNLMDDTQWRTIVDELKILSYLEKHFNLVNIVAANTANLQRREIFLLLEFCPFGDLKTFLLEKKQEFLGSINNVPGHLESEFNWSLLLTWSYSISKGMEYLANKKIMHGDLAARNILIGENNSAKISDFGLSKMMYYNEDYKKTERRMIPWAWMAVEYLQTAQFNLMSDVWSFGVTLWEIFSLGNKPYGLQSYEYMKVRILEGERLESPKTLELHPDGEHIYKQVMVRCWSETPSDRPTFSQICSILAGLLGDQGVRNYQNEEEKYLNKCVRETSETKPTKAPTGYIRVESMDGSSQSQPDTGPCPSQDAGPISIQDAGPGLLQDNPQDYLQPSEVDPSKFAYIELKPEVEPKITELKIELVQSAAPGYSKVASP